ncbi:glycerophosphodiester phosphodiesterase family protein [Flavitalea flava]
MKKTALCLFIPFIMNSCTNTPKVAGFVPFDREGHRGCRGLMPENTIPAMLHAIDLNVTTLEMDVHITRDSQVVLSHDPWFNSEITTKPDGRYIDSAEPKFILYDMTYDRIRKFDVGRKPYPKFPRQEKLPVAKPLLSDLIDSVEAYCQKQNKSVFYNIEVKSDPRGDSLYHPKPDRFVDLLMQVLNRKQIARQVIVQSFDMRSLQYLHAHYPDQKTSLLIDEGNARSFDEQIAALGFTPTVYSPHYSLVTDVLLKACHQKEVLVVPWTVNELPAMKKLKDLGVDGLISDYPDLYAGL